MVDRSGGASAPARVERARLEAEARSVAGRWPGFAVRSAKGSERGYQLTLELEVLAERPVVTASASAAVAAASAGAEATTERLAGVRLRLAPLGPGPAESPDARPARHESSVLVRRVASAGEPFEAIVREAVGEAAADIAAALALSGASDDRVLAALTGTERRVKARAIAMAGERRLSAAVAPLMALVRAEDEADQELVLKAIGALVEIKDPRAVGALIDAGRRRSARYQTQLLFAVAALGGKEAEAYLFTVATGHPEPELRRVAKEALAELERRSAAPLEPGSRRE